MSIDLASSPSGRRRRQNPPLDALDAYQIDGALADRLGIEADAVPARLWQSALYEPARSFLAAPGKGFRARLVELGWALAFDGTPPFACPPELVQIVELIHAGSLIVDDIQDASTERRGQPTLHRTHGMPLALNTGNWMYFAALGLIPAVRCEACTQADLHREAVRTMVRCHHGQALDLTVHIGLLAQHEVPGVVATTTQLKTGALMGWAAGSPAIAADPAPVRAEAIWRFGEQLGCALQMLDDLSGLVNPARAHKGIEDLKGACPTWPWAWLAESADEVTFLRLQRQARAMLGGADPEPLARGLAELVESRGRTAIRDHLDRMFVDLRAAVGNHPALPAVRAETDRLSISYL